MWFIFQEQLDDLEEKWENKVATTKVLKLELFLTSLVICGSALKLTLFVYLYR